MNTQSFTYNLVAALLRAALVLALVAAGWSIYRQLPDDEPQANGREANAQAETTLQISLRGVAGTSLDVPLELYPVDISAAQNEFFSERRPGKRLDDFLAERMEGRTPIEGRFDRNGQATLTVKPGAWWIHTTLPGELNIEWRMRVNVSGRRQAVELTPANAYTRTKSF